MENRGKRRCPDCFRRDLVRRIESLTLLLSIPMLSIRKLKKTYGGRTLFEDASMQINYGERVALVGPNGAGKSTLFGIILHTVEADAGTVDRDEYTMVGFLPQESEAVGDETVGHGPRQADRIDTEMGIEAPVLDGHHGLRDEG